MLMQTQLLLDSMLATCRVYMNGTKLLWQQRQSIRGLKSPLLCVRQDGVLFGSADRRPALLPQQGGATGCDSR